MRMPERNTDSAPAGSGLVLALVITAVTGVALGLLLAWVNIERVNLGYAVARLYGKSETRATHTRQLEVERDRLISPYILERKAQELGMRGAQPGQIRRMDNAAMSAK